MGLRIAGMLNKVSAIVSGRVAETANQRFLEVTPRNLVWIEIAGFLRIEEDRAPIQGDIAHYRLKPRSEGLLQLRLAGIFHCAG
jgi:hypothetical protein